MRIPAFSPTQVLALHAVLSLPDSTVERKRLLTVVVGVLPRNHPTRLTAQVFLKTLAQQEQLQLELAARPEPDSIPGRDHFIPRLHACVPAGRSPGRDRRRTGARP